MLRILLSVFLILCPSLSAQIQNDTTPIRLHATSRVLTTVPWAVMLPIECDTDGNIYWFHARAGEVYKLSPDGQRLTTFKIYSVPGMKPEVNPGTRRVITRGALSSYAVDSSGSVYALVRHLPDKQAYVLEFSSDGTLSGKFQLDAPSSLLPSQIAIFSSGDLLITGTLERDSAVQPETQSDASTESGEKPKFAPRAQKETPIPRKPFVGVFSTSGELKQTVSLRYDKPENPEESVGGVNIPLETGRLVASSDGNVYVLYRTTNPTIYAISSAGELIRAFRVEPPDSFEAFDMKEAQGQLLMKFQNLKAVGSPEFLYVVYSTDGEVRARYVGTPETAGGLACYENRQFTFLTADRGKMVLLHARPD